jgi:hypothetical protein
MKSKKAITIAVSILVLIATIFIVYYFFLRNDKGKCDAELVEMTLPVETKNIKSNVDDLRIETSGNNKVLVIKGWAFKQNVKEKSRELFVVFKLKSTYLVYDLDNDNVLRPGVTKHFKLDGGVDNHGFEGRLPIEEFLDSTYQIGYIIKDESGQFFTMSGKEAVFSNGTAKVQDVKIPDNRVSIPLKPTTNKIQYSFEKYDSSANKLTVRGWAYLEGMNANSIKTYIVLKGTKTTAVFSVIVEPRKDVTSYFKKTGLDLDLSGFSCKIDGRDLENGKYQVCIYIVGENLTGFIYSRNFLEIKK